VRSRRVMSCGMLDELRLRRDGVSFEARVDIAWIGLVCVEVPWDEIPGERR
jgi:hypothetical protein